MTAKQLKYSEEAWRSLADGIGKLLKLFVLPLGRKGAMLF